MTSRATIACALSVTALMAQAAQVQPPTTAQPPAAPTTQTLPEAPAAPVARDTDHSTALVLLDRIETVLDAAVQGKSTKAEAVGTSGSDDGTLKVVINRAALDEIRAEIAQIKVMLRNEVPK